MRSFDTPGDRERKKKKKRGGKGVRCCVKFESVDKGTRDQRLNSFYASDLPSSWNNNFERSTGEKRCRVTERPGDRSRADYFTNDQQRVLGSEQALNLNLVHRVQRQKHGSAADRQRPRGVSHSWIDTETKKPTNLRTKADICERSSYSFRRSYSKNSTRPPSWPTLHTFDKPPSRSSTATARTQATPANISIPWNTSVMRTALIPPTVE